MIEPARIAAFATVTALTSAVPGPSMLFVLSQSAWRSARGGAWAVAGLQLGYIVWFALAGFGLGGLLTTAPAAFRLLTLAGAAYLAWLGATAWRQAGASEPPIEGGAARRSDHPFRDGIIVALSNPKSLLYVVALLPQFIRADRPVGMQLVVLAAVAMGINVVIALAYILAGHKLSAAMSQPEVGQRIERAIGTIFLSLALLAGYASLEGMS